MQYHNSLCTCWNCPACNFKGYVDFRACGQSVEDVKKKLGIQEGHIMVECHRRPQDGLFEPTVTFERCPEWVESPYGWMLKDMRVMILGIDGYLGWTLALWLGSLGYRVSGVDNFARRKWVKEQQSYSIVPIANMKRRLRRAKEILNIDIKFKKLDILKDREKLEQFIKEIRPEAIVHYGECPSAPYSMKSVKHAQFVQLNNVIGTLGLLFSIKKIVPESQLLKLGTMGELGQPLTGRPIFEGIFPGDAVLKWQGKEWSLGGELTPRDPGSFYHLSKVHDTYNIAEACKYWWLRSTDVMQGVIYGVNTEQIASHNELRTRFDIDEAFGTVVNRMVAQAVLEEPVTVYGVGGQTRGFISLRDAMECMTRILNHPNEPGQYLSLNQMSGYYQLTELARIIKKIGKEFGLAVKIRRLQNPRIESEKHPFNPVFTQLSDVYGFRPRISLEEEIYQIFKLLIKPEIKKRIEEKRDHVIPKIWWSGQKKQVEQLELIT